MNYYNSNPLTTRQMQDERKYETIDQIGKGELICKQRSDMKMFPSPLNIFLKITIVKKN